jgi:hypothetical protein
MTVLVATSTDAAIYGLPGRGSIEDGDEREYMWRGAAVAT